VSAVVVSSSRSKAAFDLSLAGTRPRESLVEMRFEERVFRKAGWISPVVLVDGM
jgi:hypothetical protein